MNGIRAVCVMTCFLWTSLARADFIEFAVKYLKEDTAKDIWKDGKPDLNELNKRLWGFQEKDIRVYFEIRKLRSVLTEKTSQKEYDALVDTVQKLLEIKKKSLKTMEYLPKPYYDDVLKLKEKYAKDEKVPKNWEKQERTTIMLTYAGKRIVIGNQVIESPTVIIIGYGKTIEEQGKSVKDISKKVDEEREKKFKEASDKLQGK